MRNKIVVKGYRVGALIDQTGVHHYYKARRIRTNEEVILTVIKVRPGKTGEMLEKRAKISKKILHPNIVTAQDYGMIDDEQFFYSHPAILTKSIDVAASEIANKKKRNFQIVQWMIEFALMVKYLHDAGTTHRDLRTSSLRIDAKGTLLLEGFINARPKMEGRNIAKIVNLPYTSPEQLKGFPCDRKTDLYAMGVIFFELVTGSLPFTSNYNKLDGDKSGHLPSPSTEDEGVPFEIEKIILHLLSPRHERYSFAEQLLEDLEAFYDNRSLLLKMRDFVETLREFFKKKVG